MNWTSYHVDTTMKERLDAMPYRNALWSERYPELVRIWENEPATPKGNLVTRNVFWGGTWDDIVDDTRSCVSLRDNLTDQDPGFEGNPPHDFRLRADSPAFALGFQPIPVDEIGLCRPASASGDSGR